MSNRKPVKAPKLGWSGAFVVLFLILYAAWSAQNIMLLEQKLFYDLLHASDMRAAVEKDEARREQLRGEFRQEFRIQYGHLWLQVRSAALGALSIFTLIFVVFLRAYSKWVLRVLALAAVTSDVIFYFLYPLQNFPMISLPLLIVAGIWWPLFVLFYERRVLAKPVAA